MPRAAVIDLGTNTFHILIAERTLSGEILDIHRERIYVNLAEDGIHKLGTQPYQRGIDALIHFQKIIKEKKVDKVKAFGTAALRTASNGKDFIKDAKEKSNISIQLIPGSEEARLIHLGVMKAVQMNNDKGLIMDIGGGSVEFILADKNQVFWAESFPIGVAVLFNNFHKKEPISKEEISTLELHLEKILQPLFQVLQKHITPNLIGASGTFDVLENVVPLTEKTELSSTIDVIHFQPFYEKVIALDLLQRKSHPEIPVARASMMVVAIILIDIIIRKAKIKNILVSSYAMKEGILSEMI